MLKRRRDRVPTDLEHINLALRDLRPALTEERVQQVAGRARMRARHAVQQERSRVNHQKEPFLRSRLAILSTLVVGFALSGAGGALAVSGLAGQGTPAEIQYLEPEKGTTPLAPINEVIDVPSGGVDDEDQGGGAAPEKDAPERPAAERDEVPEVQETRQLGADAGDSLPVTGWAAIPVLLLGLGILAAGFVLRRNARGVS